MYGIDTIDELDLDAFDVLFKIQDEKMGNSYLHYLHDALLQEDIPFYRKKLVISTIVWINDIYSKKNNLANVRNKRKERPGDISDLSLVHQYIVELNTDEYSSAISKIISDEAKRKALGKIEREMVTAPLRLLFEMKRLRNFYIKNPGGYDRELQFISDFSDSISATEKHLIENRAASSDGPLIQLAKTFYRDNTWFLFFLGSAYSKELINIIKRIENGNTEYCTAIVVAPKTILAQPPLVNNAPALTITQQSGTIVPVTQTVVQVTTTAEQELAVEKQRADEEKQRADEAKQRADEEKQRADEANLRADQEKQQKEQLATMLAEERKQRELLEEKFQKF